MISLISPLKQSNPTDGQVSSQARIMLFLPSNPASSKYQGFCQLQSAIVLQECLSFHFHSHHHYCRCAGPIKMQSGVNLLEKLFTAFTAT